VVVAAIVVVVLAVVAAWLVVALGVAVSPQAARIVIANNATKVSKPHRLKIFIVFFLFDLSESSFFK
jgi:hypothetical protein